MMRAAFRARHYSRDWSRVPHLDFLTLHHDLGRDVDHNGTRPAGTHLPERFCHGVGDFPWPQHLPPPLGHGAHHPGLVEDLVYGPNVLADLAPWEIWPAIRRTGDERAYAVARPEAAL